jgi:5-dehydro-2-deoxygluconokinase
MPDRSFDILSMGRSSIDLYANEIGAPFTEIKSFAAYVGGCPTNISVGTPSIGFTLGTTYRSRGGSCRRFCASLS